MIPNTSFLKKGQPNKGIPEVLNKKQPFTSNKGQQNKGIPNTSFLKKKQPNQGIPGVLTKGQQNTSFLKKGQKKRMFWRARRRKRKRKVSPKLCKVYIKYRFNMPVIPQFLEFVP